MEFTQLGIWLGQIAYNGSYYTMQYRHAAATRCFKNYKDVVIEGVNAIPWDPKQLHAWLYDDISKSKLPPEIIAKYPKLFAIGQRPSLYLFKTTDPVSSLRLQSWQKTRPLSITQLTLGKCPEMN